MMYEILIYLLFHFVNGNQILVKEYTSVELVCPLSLNQSENDSLSWYYEESTPIAIQHTVNPAFKFKYKINDASNEEKYSLTIFNYSKSDQGKYICEGIINGEHKFEIFTTYLCKNSSADIQLQTSLLCSHASVYKDAEKHYEKYDKCLDSANLKLHISHQGILKEDRKKNKHTTLWKYMCLTSNEDQCTKSDLNYFIHVEWISCHERAYVELEKRIYLFTCDCGSSNVKTNSSCDEAFQLNLTSKTLYLETTKTLTKGTFVCQNFQEDVINRILTTSTLEPADYMRLTYTFGGIAAVLVGFLLFASAVIKAMFLRHKRQLQSDNLQRPVERSQSFQYENQNNDPVVPEYSEITESVHYQSAELRNNSLERNNASISTYSRNTTSAHYHTIGSWNRSNETANELYNASNDSTNNSMERNTNAVVHQYVNTNIGNTYEQLKNPTNDFHTYEDINVD